MGFHDEYKNEAVFLPSTIQGEQMLSSQYSCHSMQRNQSPHVKYIRGSPSSPYNDDMDIDENEDCQSSLISFAPRELQFTPLMASSFSNQDRRILIGGRYETCFQNISQRGTADFCPPTPVKYSLEGFLGGRYETNYEVISERGSYDYCPSTPTKLWFCANSICCMESFYNLLSNEHWAPRRNKVPRQWPRSENQEPLPTPSTIFLNALGWLP